MLKFAVFCVSAQVDLIVHELRPGMLSPMYLFQVGFLACLMLKMRVLESRMVTWLISTPRDFFTTREYSTRGR